MSKQDAMPVAKRIAHKELHNSVGLNGMLEHGSGRQLSKMFLASSG